MHLAAQDGHVIVVEILLAAGANKDATDEDGWTPMHLAAGHGHAVIVEILLAVGADISIITKSQNSLISGYLPIDVARQQSHNHIVSILLSPISPTTVAAVRAKLSTLIDRLLAIKLENNFPS